MTTGTTPPIKWIIYEPAKAVVTRIIPELAEEIGLNESIVLLQMSFWINTSDNLKDGKYWTYQTMKDMKEKAFRYWSVDTIRRSVHSLAKMGYIIIENHNKRKGDNTQWFALEPDKCSSLKSILCLPADYQARKGEQFFTPPSNLLVPPQQIASTPLQNRTTLPEITTESNTNTLSEPIGTETEQNVVKSIPDVLTQANKVVAAKVKKERKPNPNFDAVCKYIFDTDPDSVGKDGGRIGPIAQWLNGKSDGLKRAGGKVGFISRPAEPHHVKQFAEWWKRVKQCSLPHDFVKFVEGWREWASKFHKIQTAASTSTDPAQNLSIAVPVVPILLQQRNEELEPVV